MISFKGTILIFIVVLIVKLGDYEINSSCGIGISDSDGGNQHTV